MKKATRPRRYVVLQRDFSQPSRLGTKAIVVKGRSSNDAYERAEREINSDTQQWAYTAKEFTKLVNDLNKVKSIIVTRHLRNGRPVRQHRRRR